MKLLRDEPELRQFKKTLNVEDGIIKYGIQRNRFLIGFRSKIDHQITSNIPIERNSNCDHTNNSVEYRQYLVDFSPLVSARKWARGENHALRNK